jgi:AraC-like DNA-binding protein
MDVLSDVLDTVRLEGRVFGAVELAPPWGLAAAPRDVFVFHVVVRGNAWLEVDGGEPVPVGAGDVVLLARGLAHTLRDTPTSPTEPLEQWIRSGRFAVAPRGLPGTTHLLCGGFRFEDPRRDVLLAALPPVVHTHELASDVGPWLAHTVKLLAHEAGRDHPGGETVVGRLCEALFVYVIRSVLERMPDRDASWLRGLADPHVGRALRLLHAEPSAPWTVADLAAKVGMSRSAFAERFTAVVGESPMQYLVRWRIEKAAGLLRAGETGLAEIAARVGYESDAAFSKAFKRSMGVAPGAYRRAWRAGDARGAAPA